MATIPISDGDPKNTYTATSGQVTFPYTFWVKEQDHIAVYVNGTLKTLTTDYTVSAVQQPTGANIVFNSGLTEDDAVSIVYDPEYERLAEYTGTIRLDALNLELTYLLTLLQSVNRLVGDAVRLSDAETQTFNSKLPLLSGNGGKVLGVKSDLTGIEYVSVTSDATIISNYDDEAFNGDSSTTDFSLSFTPAVQAAVLVWVNGVRQRPVTDYTITGSTLSFIVAPTTGTANIVVLNTAATSTANTPADASVSTAKIQDLAVTSAKIANSAITTGKIATGDTVTKDKIDDDLITTYTDTVITASDEILFSDTTDSNNMKKDTVQGILDLVPNSYPSGYKYGLGISNGTDADHDIDIAVGVCRDSGNTTNIDIESALTKQIDASWVTGTNQGGLSSSLTVSNNTWYHVFAITVAGVDDVGFDTSITAANLVSDHVATAYRRIGSVLTDGSANIIAFLQTGNHFYWDTPILDINEAVSTTAETHDLRVPLGVSCMAICVANADGYSLYARHPDLADLAPSTTSAPLGVYDDNSVNRGVSQFTVPTNTSSEISVRLSGSGNLNLSTYGWIEEF